MKHCNLYMTKNKYYQIFITTMHPDDILRIVHSVPFQSLSKIICNPQQIEYRSHVTPFEIIQMMHLIATVKSENRAANKRIEELESKLSETTHELYVTTDECGGLEHIVRRLENENRLLIAQLEEFEKQSVPHKAE